jgi:hypothetical protein
MTRIKPTVGRKLYFYPNGDKTVNSLDDSQPIDATIIFVWSEAIVSLHIVDHLGGMQMRPSVHLIQDNDPIPAPGGGGYAKWIPFQVGQAKAQEAPQAPASMQPSAYTSTFQGALAALKDGKRVARTGWNGKGMFAYMVPPASYPVQTGAAKAHFGEGSLVPYNAYFALKDVDETVSTWVPSISDLLAEDWEVLS